MNSGRVLLLARMLIGVLLAACMVSVVLCHVLGSSLRREPTVTSCVARFGRRKVSNWQLMGSQAVLSNPTDTNMFVLIFFS
jgi:hypothetical protein